VKEMDKAIAHTFEGNGHEKLKSEQDNWTLWCSLNSEKIS